MTPEKFEEVKNANIELVKGKPLSKTWPNHTIYDIELRERDGIQVPHVIARNEENNNEPHYTKSLDTWLSDNGY